jgi:hypothetical protein
MKKTILCLCLTLAAVGFRVVQPAFAAAKPDKDLSNLIVGKFINEEASTELRKQYGSDEMEVSLEFLADGTVKLTGLENYVEGKYTIDENGVITANYPEYEAEGMPQEAFQEKYSYDAAKDGVWSYYEDKPSWLFTRAKPAFHWSKRDKDGYGRPVADDPSYSPATPSIAGEVTGTGVRLRAEPNTKSQEVGKFSTGKKVAILRRYESGKEKFPWYEIDVDGLVGWMYGEFVWQDEKGREGTLSEKRTGAAKVVRVADAKGFLEALGSDTVIEIAAGKYVLSDYTDQSVNYQKGVEWEYAYAGDTELTLRSLRNLTIRGADEGSHIVVDPQCSFVMSFEDCANITLENVTAGHSAGGWCTGGVFAFAQSSKITIKDTKMYGSGTEGLSLSGVTDMTVLGSSVYECSYYIMTIADSANVLFEGCEFHDNNTGESRLVGIGGADGVTFDGCRFADNRYTGKREQKMFDVGDSKNVTVKKSVFSGNSDDGIEQSANVKFDGCKFEKKAGAGSSADELKIYQPVFDDLKQQIETEEIAWAGIIDFSGSPLRMSDYRYLLRDLDSDGVSELLIFGKGWDESALYPLIAAFTIADGDPKMLDEFWARSRGYLTVKNYILNEGSSGADDSGVTVYKLSGGELRKVEAPDLPDTDEDGYEGDYALDNSIEPLPIPE